MSHNDDPPFLAIGTEVSAKYRGAFCEATIKVAKKLVKCKVSFSKGQTVVVSNDVIKGTLKVGNQVDVRQLDGQYKLATILKLTDQSTYTVVFDDGDERTLKRSSLCLKGARHYHESESLDNTPLTDPENFGTPVMQSSKKTRNNKRQRPSHSPTREEMSKKKCCYPPEFPVGKVVFLENDRRRSCWLPAVVVPAHYVMEESDMTPDAICIRSFKDGRFFASTKNELHDFAPDKEPLLSMLEGEIQAMYRCKPAIERAMTYLNTGGLPWDMDLFTSRNDEVFPRIQTPSPPRPPTPKKVEVKKVEVKKVEVKKEEVKKEEVEKEEENTAEKSAFMEKLKKLHESKGTPLTRQPTLAQKDLNLFKLYRLVMENGGMEKVTQDLKWRSLYLQLGMPPVSNASYTIKQAYKKYLLPFETSEKTKSKTPPPPPQPPVVKDSPSRTNRRRTVSDEEHNRQQQEKAEKAEKATKVTRQTSKDALVREPLKNAVKREEVEQQPKVQERLEPTVNHDVKSETSDPESSQVDSGSSNGDDMEDQKLERRGLEQCVAGYRENDRILVRYGKGKTLQTYEAKILGIEENESQRDYLVHYNGWNMRYDEWIEEQRIAGRLTGPSKGFTRPVYKKKSKKAKQLPPPPPDGSVTGAKGKEKKENKKTTHSSSGKPPAATTTSSPSISVPDVSSSESGSTSSSSSTHSSSGSGKGGAPATRGPGRPPKRRKSSAPTDGSGNESPFSPPSMPKLPELPLPTSTNTTTTTTTNTTTTVNKKPSAPSPKTETPALSSSPLVPKVELLRTNLVPEKEMEMEMDEAIEVKREENFSWSPGDVNTTDPLACSERLSDPLKPNIKPNPDQQPPSPTPSKSQEDSPSPPVSPKRHSSTDSLKPIDQPAASTPSPPPAHINNNSDLSSSPTLTSSGCLDDGDQEDRMEVDEKSSDEKSSRSESPPSPPNEQQSPIKGSPLLEGKRRLREFETEEEYEERKKARRANMNYVINFGQLPEMTSGERVALIQERIRDVEKRWMELKNEVAYLDRKRRRARRKEREASRNQANQAVTTANTNSHLQSPTIECH